MGSIIGRIGGAVEGYDINCTSDGSRIHGRFGGVLIGGEVFGFDVDLEYDRQSGRLSGRLGGDVIGHDVDAAVTDIPVLPAAALIAAVYYQHQHDHRHSGGGAHNN